VPEIRRAVVKSYDAASHKASVQIAGSLAVWLEDVRVATNIPAADVVAGRPCSVLFLDEHNPADAVILEVHGALPSPSGGIPTRIEDADTDTAVNTEASADEDKVRIKVAGTERALYQTASPHITLTGDIRLGAAAEHVSVKPASNLLLQASASGAHAAGLTWIQAVGQVTASAFLTYQGVAGTPTAALASGATGVNLFGLNFSPAVSAGGGGASVTAFTCIKAQPFLSVFTGTVADLKGLHLPFPWPIAGAPVITRSVGVHIADYGPTTAFVDTTGLLIEDIGLATGFRRIIEAGGTIGTLPNLRLEANAPTSPGVDKGRSRVLATFNENGALVLRRHEWKDFGTLAAGDRVMVAV
jgi:hypothetical protein